jgi:hypothetical protein
MLASTVSWLLSTGTTITTAPTSVRTHGVNWEGILTTVAALCIVILPMLKWVVGSTVGGIVDRNITPRFKSQEVKLSAIEDHLANHDNRIAKLEGIEEGKRSMLRELSGPPASTP